MKLETIKRNNKKKIIIGSMIVLSVVGCLTLTTTRAKYRSVQNLKLASGTVKLNQYDFKIMAMYQSEDGETYTDIATMPETGYVINEEKSYCTTDNKTQVKGKLKTVNGIHGMYGLTKNDKCYIWFDKKNASDTILMKIKSMNNVYKENLIPDFANIATGTESEDDNGVYAVEDPMYNSNIAYYWRGAATTNHVIFDSKCWRIVRINGDKTIRLIYNGTPTGTTCPGVGNNGSVIMGSSDAEKYYSTSDGKRDNPSYAGWTYTLNTQRTLNGTDSNAKVQIEKWYNNNITTPSKTKVDSNGKFCNDRELQKGVNWSTNTNTSFNYAAINRIGSHKPTLSCNVDDIYSLSVGMITADDAIFAGAGSGMEDNGSYYLYSGVGYYTMTPYTWSRSAFVYAIYANGTLGCPPVNSTAYGLRPVINLRSDVTFNSEADGTQNNPYIVQ